MSNRLTSSRWVTTTLTTSQRPGGLVGDQQSLVSIIVVIEWMWENDGALTLRMLLEIWTPQCIDDAKRVTQEQRSFGDSRAIYFICNEMYTLNSKTHMYGQLYRKRRRSLIAADSTHILSRVCMYSNFLSEEIKLGYLILLSCRKTCLHGVTRRSISCSTNPLQRSSNQGQRAIQGVEIWLDPLPRTKRRRRWRR